MVDGWEWDACIWIAKINLRRNFQEEEISEFAALLERLFVLKKTKWWRRYGGIVIVSFCGILHETNVKEITWEGFDKSGMEWQKF